VSTDTSEDDCKDDSAAVKENVATDNKPSSTDNKRQLSVREKAAAFLDSTSKDSVC